MKVVRLNLGGEWDEFPMAAAEGTELCVAKRDAESPTQTVSLMEEAVFQVLQERWDRTFSEQSYGFRTGRSARQAVAHLSGSPA